MHVYVYVRVRAWVWRCTCVRESVCEYVCVCANSQSLQGSFLQVRSFDKEPLLPHLPHLEVKQDLCWRSITAKLAQKIVYLQIDRMLTDIRQKIKMVEHAFLFFAVVMTRWPTLLRKYFSLVQRLHRKKNERKNLGQVAPSPGKLLKRLTTTPYGVRVLKTHASTALKVNM